MDETTLGYKVTGTWETIVEHGERMEAAIEIALNSLVDDNESISEEQLSLLEDFGEWRPKISDKSEDGSVNKRTAKSASTETNEERPTDSLAKAGKELKDREKKTTDQLKNTASHIAKATENSVKNTTKEVEEFVYQNVMTVISPYYFDNQLLSASLWKKDDSTFVFEVNVNDDSVRNVFREHADDLEMNISRWHTEAEVDTDNHAAAESDEINEDSRTPTKDKITDEEKREDMYESSDSRENVGF